MPSRSLIQLLKRAINLKKSLGVRCAAGYLRNREVQFDVAYFAMFGRLPRELA
jgi:hypothetical protein